MTSLCFISYKKQEKMSYTPYRLTMYFFLFGLGFDKIYLMAVIINIYSILRSEINVHVYQKQIKVILITS